jgi:hypothetical protein
MCFVAAFGLPAMLFGVACPPSLWRVIAVLRYVKRIAEVTDLGYSA